MLKGFKTITVKLLMFKYFAKIIIYCTCTSKYLCSSTPLYKGLMNLNKKLTPFLVCKFEAKRTIFLQKVIKVGSVYKLAVARGRAGAVLVTETQYSPAPLGWRATGID